MNAGAWLGAVFGAAVLAAVLVLSASLEPDHQRDDGGAAFASTRAVPTPEATFPPGPVLSEPITLYEAPERVQRIEFAPGEVVDRPGFYYFWDVETGVVEGWGPPGNPEFPFPMFDAASSDSRFLARIRLQEDFLLIDRNSGSVYSYNGSEGWPVSVPGEDFINTLVTHNGSVLFYTEAGELAVIDFDDLEPKATSRIVYPDTLIGAGRGGDYFQALFSPDGTRLALLAEDVQLYDLATGEEAIAGERPLAGRSLGQFAQRKLEPSADGSFIASLLDMDFETGTLGWARYAWDGALLGEGIAQDVMRAGASFSPDGEHVAWTQSYLGDYTITALIVGDVSTGEPQFRVMGLNACDACTWLNDETVYGTTSVELEPLTYGATVTLDGNIAPRQRLPRPVDVDPVLGEVRLIDLDDTVTDTRAVDWNALQGITQGSLAWDEANATVRFSTPVLGRDYGGAAPMPIAPELERSPFADLPAGTLTHPPAAEFTLAEVYTEPSWDSELLGSRDGASGFVEDFLMPDPERPWLVDQWTKVTLPGGREGWTVATRFELSLRAEPGKRGEIVQILDYPVRVTFLETKMIDEPEDAYWRGGEVWARVRLEDGAEGWILLHARSYL